MMKKIIIYTIVLLVSANLMGQSSKMPITLSYFAPYGINPGLKIGTSHTAKEWRTNAETRLQKLEVSPQVGFWSASAYSNNVHRTFLLDAQLEYRLYTKNEKRYILASVGLGYHLSLESPDLNVNLGTGEINRNRNIAHHFVPTFNAGFGHDLTDKIGYYFKAFVGERFNSTGNDLLFGAELGLSFYLIK